jgi:peptide/nickel transport system ATP-binding protein
LTATLEVSELNIALRGTERSIVAVRDVSFTILPGRTLGLVGESGAGKSLTSMAVPGLLPRGDIEMRGSIRLLGHELVGLSERELMRIRSKQIGMVFQEPRQSFNPAFKVGEQIAETVRWHEGASRRAGRDRAVELLELTGIANAAQRVDDYPHTFSGGMLQRAMIAMAIACRPAVLIADEPTAALDVTVQKQILKLLSHLQASLGMAMLFVSHDMATVAQICDDVAVMYAGTVVECGPALNIYRRPRHPYTQGLLRSVPNLKRRGEPLYSIPGSMPSLNQHPPGCRFEPRCRYAKKDCQTAPIAMQNLGDAHVARCIRAEELNLAEVSA